MITTRTAHTDPKVFDVLTAAKLARDHTIFATRELLHYHSMCNDPALRAILEDIGEDLEIAVLSSMATVVLCEGLI